MWTSTPVGNVACTLYDSSMNALAVWRLAKADYCATEEIQGRERRRSTTVFVVSRLGDGLTRGSK